MNKSNLRTGMVIEDYKGARGVVLLGTVNGDIIGGSQPISEDEHTWFPLSTIDENLEAEGKKRIYKIWDIPPNCYAGSVNKTGALLYEYRSYKFQGKDYSLKEIKDLKKELDEVITF
jgi:hypothetical protein